MNTVKLKAQNKSAQSGTAITELVLVLPLLLIILSGLTQLGWTFGHINWVANISYEVAMVGGGTPQASGGQMVMTNRYNQLRDIPYYRSSLPNVPNVAQYNNVERTVDVRLNATLPILLSYISPTFDVHAVAPILVLGNGQPGELSVFSNAIIGGVPRFYDCCGDLLPINSPPPTSCFPAPNC